MNKPLHRKKIAICLFGNLGHSSRSGQRTPSIRGKNFHQKVLKESSTADTDPRKGYHNLKHLIMDHYSTDVFCHCWNVEYQERILSLYKPKKSIFENQKDFDTNLENYNINENERNINKWNMSEIAKKGYNDVFENRNNWEKTIEEFKIQAFRTSSRLYSTKRVIELKTQYEEEHNFKYDIVLICRYDNFWNYKYNLNLNTLDNTFCYLEYRKNRKDSNYSVNDLWILCNSDISNLFGKMFDERFNYCIRCPISIFEMIKHENIKYKLI